MYRVDWGRLGQSHPSDREQMAIEACSALRGTLSESSEGATTLVQLLGHKGDLMVIAFRRSFDELGRTQLTWSRTKLHAYLEPTASYVSIVELGMYDMTAKLHRQLAEQGLIHDTDAYNDAFEAEMERQRQRVSSRLFGPIPPTRHVCFYPMNKRRGEVANWYAEPFERRAEMMLEHGKVGREYLRTGHADHLGIDRLRRLGMGCRSVCGRPGDVQEADLRDAVRRGERKVRRVRAVLRRVAVFDE